MDNTSDTEKYPLLSKIETPRDLKRLPVTELIPLSGELRNYIIETVTQTGGHLAPSLGAVDLTIALHYVFDTPQDKLVWDVGHQAYGHKILTGRKEAIKTIRQYGGLSGFCKRSESEYDVFGAGHASTSISAALGIAVARDLKRENYRVVAIIGDGSFTGGLAYEAMNNTYGHVNGQFLVILNDNKMSISRNVGALANYLTRIVTSPGYLNFKNQVWNSLALLPRGTSALRKLGRKILESLKNFLAPGVVFEEFGFRYFGPIDGHNIPRLIKTLNNIKDLPYPVLLHVITQKGKGLLSAETDPTKYHGISPSIKNTAADSVPGTPFLKAFSKIALEIGDKFPETVFITAAMAEGTGLTEFAHHFPTRYFDVGIAEGHAVTFAGGLAANGLRPVVAIYSTFLQRAYDHIIHDVALQNLPVVFVLDRGGLVGEDGPTHHGAFDLSYLSSVPNMIIAAPRDGNELRDLLFTAISQNKQPFAIRYPKDNCYRFDEDGVAALLPIGKWEVLNRGEDVAIISVGVMSEEALKARSILEQKGIFPTVVHARFVKPFDETLLLQLVKEHQLIFTVEENSIRGGFGANVSRFLLDNNRTKPIYSLAIPDQFIEHGERRLLLTKIGLTAEGIAQTIVNKINS